MSDSVPRLPDVDLGTTIPKVLHQISATTTLPPVLAANAAAIRATNPTWRYELHDHAQALRYVTSHYGPAVAELLLRIDPRYGPARADLFRYLLMYREGGFYLDIKSTTTRPLDEVLMADDRFVLAQWRNGADQAHPGRGLQRELASVPGGEYQQWWIACAPGHPFLRAVIESVLDNITAYRPWHQGVGKGGVLRVTGPIPYTLAIAPVRHLHPHRQVGSEAELGLEYSILPGMAHERIAKHHYSRCIAPVVRTTGARWIAFNAYALARGGYTRSRTVLRGW